jgi:hypothetical protein
VPCHNIAVSLVPLDSLSPGLSFGIGMVAPIDLWRFLCRGKHIFRRSRENGMGCAQRRCGARGRKKIENGPVRHGNDRCMGLEGLSGECGVKRSRRCRGKLIFGSANFPTFPKPEATNRRAMAVFFFFFGFFFFFFRPLFHFFRPHRPCAPHCSHSRPAARAACRDASQRPHRRGCIP